MIEMMPGISQPTNAFFELPDFICVGLWGRFDEDCSQCLSLGGRQLGYRQSRVSIALMQSQQGLARYFHGSTLENRCKSPVFPESLLHTGELS